MNEDLDELRLRAERIRARRVEISKALNTAYKHEAVGLKREAAVLKEELHNVCKRINNVALGRGFGFINREGGVTDHAVIRWLERVHGLDVEAIRRDIMEAVEKAYYGDGRLRINKHETAVKVTAPDDSRYVIGTFDGNIITSYMKEDV